VATVRSAECRVIPGGRPVRVAKEIPRCLFREQTTGNSEGIGTSELLLGQPAEEGVYKKLAGEAYNWSRTERAAASAPDVAFISL